MSVRIRILLYLSGPIVLYLWLGRDSILYDTLFWLWVGCHDTILAGYFFHRFCAHHGRGGLLGGTARRQHIDHHLIKYPGHHFQEEGAYNSSHEWHWYLLVIMNLEALVLIGLLGILTWKHVACIALGASALGYFGVGVVHDIYHIKNHWLHLNPFTKKNAARLLKLHRLHHVANANYGIIFFYPDILFGTYRDTFPELPENIFPTRR